MLSRHTNAKWRKKRKKEDAKRLREYNRTLHGQQASEHSTTGVRKDGHWKQAYAAPTGIVGMIWSGPTWATWLNVKGPEISRLRLSGLGG